MRTAAPFVPASPGARWPRLLAPVALILISGCVSVTTVRSPAAGSTDAAAASSSGAGTTTTASPADRPAAGAGAIVAGPSNITSFAPADTSVGADLETLSFKRIFDELGEDTALWYQHVQTLANPYFEGRVNGSAGTQRARDYISFFFDQYGLEAPFPSASGTNGYEQPFEFQTRGRMRVEVVDSHADVDGRALVAGEEYVLLGNSASAEVSGPITFVGYGIDDGPGGYTSFTEETDLSGRVALLLRYEPLDEDGFSLWAQDRFSPNAALAAKMGAVQRRGAAGIILVTPPECADGRTGLESVRQSARFGRRLQIPAIQMTPEAVESLLAAADPDGRDLMAWRRLSDDGAVGTLDLSDTVTVTFGGTLERNRSSSDIPAANVGATLPGRGTLAGEWLVIGGHFDHNGYGQFGTTPDAGPLFPGADDNASGTAGMLVLAKRLSETYAETPDDADLRSVLFLAFDAEERGLHGSRYFIDNPNVDPDTMTALLNMDMIGRLRSNSLHVLGTATADGLEEILEPHFQSSGLIVATNPAGSGRSDDANFNRVGVPGMHFFTGMHEEYTSPADKAYTVNPIGAGKIIDLMESIAMDLATRPDMLLHASDSPPTAPPAATPATPGANRGYAPVRLGIRPGMGEALETGILVDGVSEGTSAAEAGIMPGDVMLFWGDVELDGMRTLVEQLRERQPGDVVTIRVRRGETTIDIPVTLKASE